MVCPSTTLLPMTTEKIDGVSVTTQASVYFDGKCVSHGIRAPETGKTACKQAEMALAFAS